MQLAIRLAELLASDFSNRGSEPPWQTPVAVAIRLVLNHAQRHAVGLKFDQRRGAHNAAIPELGVSMPVSWDNLAKLKGGDQTVATDHDHLSLETSDPWADYWKKKQSLSAAMKTLGFKPAKTGTYRGPSCIHYQWRALPQS